MGNTLSISLGLKLLKLVSLFLAFALLGCIHRKSITAEVTSYGSLSAPLAQLKLGVLWSVSDQISTEDKMVLNHIAQKMVDEAQLRGIDSFLVKTDEDFDRLRLENSYLAVVSYAVNQTSSYVPPSTYTIYTPHTEFHSGSISSPGSLNSYNYSGTTTTQREEKITTGGYTVTEYCRKVNISYLTYLELSREKPETSYLQKIISCGKNNDIRMVISEMLEGAFNSLGKEGQFKETIFYEQPRNSPRRYAK